VLAHHSSNLKRAHGSGHARQECKITLTSSLCLRPQNALSVGPATAGSFSRRLPRTHSWNPHPTAQKFHLSPRPSQNPPLHHPLIPKATVFEVAQHRPQPGGWPGWRRSATCGRGRRRASSRPLRHSWAPPVPPAPALPPSAAPWHPTAELKPLYILVPLRQSHHSSACLGMPACMKQGTDACQVLFTLQNSPSLITKDSTC
jgi:hypothetical protein